MVYVLSKRRKHVLILSFHVKVCRSSKRFLRLKSGFLRIVCLIVFCFGQFSIEQCLKPCLFVSYRGLHYLLGF